MKAIITGVGGFIGSNLAYYLLTNGWDVVGIDNLSRVGSAHNVTRLRDRHRTPGASLFDFWGVSVTSDIHRIFKRHGRGVDAVFHLAGQVAVTKSIENPRLDFESNVLGTFNVLEAVRKHKMDAVVVYASTNKVYGTLCCTPGLADVNAPISEEFPLDFHSPYGCSKGAADQYVVDYARIYGMRTVVMRQSCIYGPWQYGIEDQGWVAWFTIAAMLGKEITIYGDGSQVRDVLWVEDLIEAYARAVARMGPNLLPYPNPVTPGSVYNIGGGPENTISLLDLVTLLESILGHNIPIRFARPRPGDQKVYVSDIRKASRELGWKPKVGVKEGVERLVKWVEGNIDHLRRMVG
jgi:CDP-paratose 2-epimerase